MAGLLSIGGIVTTAILGLQALGFIFTVLPTATKTIINMLQTGSYLSTFLISFLLSAAGIYITMKLLQAARGTVVEP